MSVSFSYSQFDIKYLAALEHEFGKFDSDKNGRLDETEFCQWLVAGGVKEKVAKDLFFVADSDNDGTVSLEEFKNYAQLRENMVNKNEILPFAKNIYNAIKSRSGNKDIGLNKKEFLKFMDLMNFHVKFTQKRKTFKAYDMDGNGTVEFDEIMRQFDYKKSILLDTNE